MIRLLRFLFPGTARKVRQEIRRDNAQLARVFDDVIRDYDRIAAAAKPSGEERTDG